MLESVAPGIGKLVSHRQVLTPVDLEQQFGLTGGHPLHAEPGLDQFFVWRPLLGHARYRLALERLYLCGSGAHPGGGITGGPGQNAAREILKDLARARRARRRLGALVAPPLARRAAPRRPRRCGGFGSRSRRICRPSRWPTRAAARSATGPLPRPRD